MTIVVGYIPTPEGLTAVDRAVQRVRVDGSQQDLDALVSRLGELGVQHEVRQQDQATNAAEEILGAATEVGADLIVIGIRRRSPVGKLVAGSTAQAVLLGASCDVLAVKTAPTV